MEEKRYTKEELILNLKDTPPSVESVDNKELVEDEVEQVRVSEEEFDSFIKNGKTSEEILNRIADGIVQGAPCAKEVSSIYEQHAEEIEAKLREKYDNLESEKKELPIGPEGSPEQQEQIKKIEKAIQNQKKRTRLEALKEGVLLPLIKARGAYERIPQKYRKILTTSLRLGVMIVPAALVVAGLLDDDSRQGVQTIMDSIPEDTSVYMDGIQSGPVSSPDVTLQDIDVPAYGFPEAADVPVEQITSSVSDGGNTWNSIETALDDKGLMEGYDANQRNEVIDAIKDSAKELGPDEIRARGISSGDINIVQPGEQIDLTDLFEKHEDLFAHSLERVVEPLGEIDTGLTMSQTTPAVELNDPVADAMFGEENATSTESQNISLGEGVITPEVITHAEIQANLNTAVGGSTDAMASDTGARAISEKPIEIPNETANSTPPTTETFVPMSAMLERMPFDYKEVKSFFENFTVPSFIENVDGINLGELFPQGGGDIYHLLDPETGLSGYDVQDIYENRLPPEVDTNVAEQARRLVDLITNKYGHALPGVGEHESFFDFMKRTLGEFSKT